MKGDRPDLAQLLTADRLVFERARTHAQALTLDIAEVEERVRVALGIVRLTTAHTEARVGLLLDEIVSNAASAL